MLPTVPADPFAALFAHVAPSAQTFFAGNLCQTAQFADGAILHLLKHGSVRVRQKGLPEFVLTEPTLLLVPRACAHAFDVPEPAEGADLVCATVDLGGRYGGSIAQGLPELIVLPLASHAALGPVCDLMVAEAFSEGGGRQAALDRLFDYLLILILRQLVTNGTAEGGVLAGLADPRLAKALSAMHEAPRRQWSLEDLAEVAGMSRTRFADHFRAVIGRTPIEYLTQWRMTIARHMLAKGKTVKTVANATGYNSAAAFSRAFTRVTGFSPGAVAEPETG